MDTMTSGQAAPAADLHRPLNALDRCDSCGAQAFVVVTASADLDLPLMFCAHHFNAFSPKMTGILLRDERDSINKKPSPSA